MFWLTKSIARPETRVTALNAPPIHSASELDAWILSLLQTRGPMMLNDLIARMADRLYREAVRDGAASVDIGLFGAKLFYAEAATLVARGDGQWWAIDNGRQSVPSASPVAESSVQESVR